MRDRLARVSKRFRPLQIWALAALITLLSVVPSAAAANDRAVAIAALKDGVDRLRSGQITEAMQSWTTAIDVSTRVRLDDIAAEAFGRRGEINRVIGHPREALADLRCAKIFADRFGDRLLRAGSAGALGGLLFRIGNLTTTGCPFNPSENQSQDTEDPQILLNDSLKLARQYPPDLRLVAAAANDLGNLTATRVSQSYEVSSSAPRRMAEAHFQEALEAASAAGDQTLAATAEINLAHLALAASGATGSATLNSAKRHAKALIINAVQRLLPLAQSDAVATVLIAAGSVSSDTKLANIQRVALVAALDTAQRLGNPGLEFWALGALGRLHEHAGHVGAALELTRRALFRAQQIAAEDLVFRWEWQKARIERMSGDPAAALTDYRRAVHDLQFMRDNMPIDYQAGISSFAIYREYADLLLLSPGVVRKELLTEARGAVEMLRRSELQDFFRRSCIPDFIPVFTSSDRLPSDTAVIYPLVLADRVEILLRVGGTDARFTEHVSAEAVGVNANLLRRTLTIPLDELQSQGALNDYAAPARWLYDHLLRQVVEHGLAGRAITTIVVVPDAILRTVPFAALYDGRSYVIEHYALSLLPGLDLYDPSPPARARQSVLAAALTTSLNRPALTHTADVIRDIAVRNGGSLLTGTDFRKDRLDAELRIGRYNTVIVGSHAAFGSDDPKDTFILGANDERIGLSDLRSMFRRAATTMPDHELELLMLSACETAAGDDLAVLGIAGLAVQVWARSAVATLWEIQDIAAGDLVRNFFSVLDDNAHGQRATKARALQSAQVAMLHDKLLFHPHFWAPMVLVGNWL